VTVRNDKLPDLRSYKTKQTPWPESARNHLSEKLVPNSADRILLHS
jgi:hypothetical protein